MTLRRLVPTVVVLLCGLPGCGNPAVPSSTQSRSASSTPIAPSSSTAPRLASRSALEDLVGLWEVRWDRTFVGWQPPVFEGYLSVERRGGEYQAELAFDVSSWKPKLTSMRADGDQIEMHFRVGDGDLDIHGWLKEGRFIGEMRAPKVDWSPFSLHRLPALRKGAADHSLPRADVVDESEAMNALLLHAARERSSAVVIAKDGKIVVERYRDGYDGGTPIMAMSASKSLVSIAVGLLIADKKLSLDTRMDSLFTEWKGLGKKSAITVRQLLSHTSGLDPSRAVAQRPKETIFAHALRAKLVFSPGTRFQYNNDAVDFLAAVVAKAAGKPLDVFLEERVFRKLDVQGAWWKKDAEGTPQGAGELSIRPVDLAKVGQLLLDEGVGNGEAIIPSTWIAESWRASQSFNEACGYLWWREGSSSYVLSDAVLDGWRDAGVRADALAPLRALLGKSYASRDEYAGALTDAAGRSVLADIERAVKQSDHLPFNGTRMPTAYGFSARGWLGQYLVVYPDKHLVAVRMRAMDAQDSEDSDRASYGNFARDVRALY